MPFDFHPSQCKDKIMKKILLAIVMVATVGLAGCSEKKDKAYYLQNIDKAETKKAECEKKLIEALTNKDKKLVESLQQDAECQAAIDAVKEARQAKAEQERQAKEAKMREETDREKAKITQELGQTDWKGVLHYVVNSDCAQQYANMFSKSGFIVPKENYRCLAVEQLYAENLELGKAELSKLSYDELLNQEKDYCSKDKRPLSACALWETVLNEQAEKAFIEKSFEELDKQKAEYARYNDKHPASARKAFEKAFREKEKEVIENYTKNYDLLKQDYNQCIEKVKNIADYNARLAITDAYPCSQTKSARSKLGLAFDNFKTMME